MSWYQKNFSPKQYRVRFRNLVQHCMWNVELNGQSLILSYKLQLYIIVSCSHCLTIKLLIDILMLYLDGSYFVLIIIELLTLIYNVLTNIHYFIHCEG